MNIKTIRVLDVFLSCPNDVEDERRIAGEVCEQLNQSSLVSKGIELVPKDWEKDVVPVITGDGGQAEIDKQIGPYDIYIGIMWKRFGDKKENGLTGTQKEFEDALDRRKRTGKPVIQFYFKLAFYSPQNDYEKCQIDEVGRFKQRVQELGLYQSFENEEEFREKLARHLGKIAVEFDFLTAQETLVPKIAYTEVKPYLPRKICSTEDYASGRLFYLKDESAKDPLEIIPDCKRMVLISGPGVGKTTELRRIAWQACDAEFPLYPCLVLLNKYTNQSISDFLPEDWQDVPGSKWFVILDGFDEIESKNRNDAIRQIELFAEQHPSTHILISCRTNFYDSKTEGLSGTLYGFSSYVLLELDEMEIRDFVKDVLKQDEGDFHAAISNNRLHDLLGIPFYLIRLVGLFKKNHALPKHKAEIFEQLLQDRIQLDIEHFRTTRELRRKQKTIIQALERLALGMEILGRNYITDSEYSRIVENESLRELIEHCTVWNKKEEEPEGGKWQFEHNNFQEYLAARLLSNKSLSTLKQFLFFGPDYRKLIPSWSNTLSFLISISNDRDLIQWVMDNEAELAVKFEPDRIETETRIEVFKSIFNHYKGKKVWINHEKFRYDELARFGQSDDIVDFVLSEGEKAEHYTTASNAIELLSHLDVPNSKRERACNFLVKHALDNSFGNLVQCRALMAIADLRLNSLDVVNKITQAIQTSESEWVRYGLYYFLHNSDHLDGNIDVFLCGLQYFKFDVSSTRSRLMDEHMHCQTGLEKAKAPDALLKILRHFSEHPQELSDVLLERSIPIIAENAANACSSEPSLFEAGKSLFEALVDKLLDKEAGQFVVFFDKTGTRLQMFREYLSQEEDSTKRWRILGFLADNDCMEFFVEQYEHGKLRDDDVLTFRNCLAWKNSELCSPFNDLINAKTGDKFLPPPERDYGKERHERTQRDFNLLFDKQAFLAEIQLVFETEDKNTCTNRDILDIQSSHWDNPYFSHLAIDNLRTLSREKPVTYDGVVDAVNSWDCDWFCVCKVYEKVDHNEGIVLTEKQKAWMADWCYSHLDGVDFRKALVTKSKGESSTSWLAVFLWYFLRKFNLVYPKDVLLDLLSYDWREGGQYIGIEYLEALLSKHEITTRVVKNLEEGIANDDILKNHLDYCKRYEVTEVLPDALSELANPNREDDVKRVALDTVCDLSRNPTVDLENVLPQISDDFKWNVIEKLAQNNSQTCHKHLLVMLQTTNEEEKMKAAKYLIQLQDLEGLKYYLEWVKQNKKPPEQTHHDKSPLVHLSMPESVPYLIELLEVSYRSDFTKSRFDHFEHDVLDALTRIALQSDENYQGIRKAMLDFINKNTGKIPNVNFLNIFLERLDQKHYVAKSEKLDINHAITKLTELSQNLVLSWWWWRIILRRLVLWRR